MQKRWEIGIGLLGLLFALTALIFWFPNDIKGDFMELTRAGKSEPGDAFFPILLTLFIAFFSVIQVISGALRAPENDLTFRRITLQNLAFLSALLVIILISLGLMYWLGPLVVAISGSTDSYRKLLDTIPYKYIGVVAGGFSMTFTLITWAEGRVRKRTAAASIILLILLILIFDVALTNIQLPPNADY